MYFEDNLLVKSSHDNNVVFFKHTESLPYLSIWISGCWNIRYQTELNFRPFSLSNAFKFMPFYYPLFNFPFSQLLFYFMGSYFQLFGKNFWPVPSYK